jgi:hypothetical protein
VIYEFEADEVRPEYRDPPAAALIARDLPRHALMVRRQLEARSPALRACYRWASGTAPPQPARLRAAFTVDPWGDTHDVHVTPDAPRSATLALCLRDVLAGLRLLPGVARRTRITLVQRFRPSGQPAPTSPWPRPALTRPSPWPGRACLLGPATLPEDVLDLGDTLAPVTDFDWLASCRKNEAERVAKELEKCRAAGVLCRTHPRRCWDGQRWGQVIYRPRHSKEEIRRAFRQHRGDLQACYREALSRRPGLQGTLTIRARWLSGGLPLEVTVTGEPAPDPVLAACVHQVATRVSLSLLQHAHDEQVTYPLRLVPDPLDDDPSPGLTGTGPLCLARRRAVAHAEAALAAHDGEVALRWLTALRVGQRTCRLTVLSVQAALRVHPWESPALDPLLEAFVRDVRAPGARAVRACWDDLTRSLGEPIREALATHQELVRLDRVEAAARRLGLLLGHRPPPDWALEAAYARAEALRLLGRLREAEAAFRRVARDARGSLAERAAQEAAECAGRLLQEENIR